MIKAVFLQIVLLFTFNLAKAHSYNIQTFEGNKAVINLVEMPGGLLFVSYLKDSLKIADFVSVDSVEVLDKVFLKITYAKRAGSNEDFMNQLLLCICNNSLCQALHINSLTTYDLRPNEYSLFKLKVSLTGHDIDTYKLSLITHSEKSSQQNSKLNYSYDKTMQLFFSKKYNIFYNNYFHLKGYYTFHNFKAKSGKNRYIENDVPVVEIKNDKYYCINGDWFTKNKDHFYSMML